MIDFAVWDDTFAVERIDTPNVTGTKWSAAIPRGHLYGAQMADIAKFESLPRSVVGNGTLGAHTSGGLFLTAVPMKRGEKITTLTFVVAAAPTAQTNLWLALYDRNLNLLGVTNDMTTTAPIAGGTVTGTLATPYVTKYEGLYYVGIVQVATTVSTVRGNQTTSNLNYTPRLSGASTAGLTTPGTAPNPAATMASTAIIPWVAVG
jgi:hypothetical protein